MQSGSELDCTALNGLPRAVRTRVLRLFLDQNGLKKDLSFAHVQALCALCERGAGTVDLPDGMAAQVVSGKFSLVRQNQIKITSGEEFCLPLVVGQKIETPVGILFAERISRPKRLSAQDRFCCVVPEKTLIGAVVRSAVRATRIRPLGATGSKKLKDFYIDRKIPPKQREYPVVARESTVLFACGAGASELCRTGEEKEVVRLRFVPYEFGIK